MCGNGGRCIARFAFLHRIVGHRMSIEALHFVYQAEVMAEKVRLSMKDPGNFEQGIDFSLDGHAYSGFSLDTGSPHFVTFVDSLDAIPVSRLGREIRYAKRFAPDGTNVDFAQIEASDTVRLRTYERGVEVETLACGTGAVATGIVASMQRGLSFPVTIEVRSGETLLVSAQIDNGRIHSPVLEGSAHILFDGRVCYDTVQEEIVDLHRQPSASGIVE